MGVLALTLTTARLASGAITVNDDVDIVTTRGILFSLASEFEYVLATRVSQR